MGIQINGNNDTITAIDGSITVGTDLTVPGVLTYEDVTSVDAVGLSTFQNGLNVTGGSIGIGTDNPTSPLHIANGTAVVKIEDNTSGQATSVAKAEFRYNNGPLGFVGYNGDEVGSLELWNSYSGSVILGTSDSERLRITSGGNIGIGTDNPQHNLHLYNNGDATLFIQADADNVDEDHNPKISMSQDGQTSSIFDIGINGSTGNSFTDALGNTAYLYSVSNLTSNGIQFATNGAARMYLNNSGNLGIGTNDPDGLLTIQGDSDESTTPSIRLKDGTDTREVSITNNSGDFIVSTHGTDNEVHGRIQIFEGGQITIANGGASGSLTSRISLLTSGDYTIQNALKYKVWTASGAANGVTADKNLIGWNETNNSRIYGEVTVWAARSGLLQQRGYIRYAVNMGYYGGSYYGSITEVNRENVAGFSAFAIARSGDNLIFTQTGSTAASGASILIEFRGGLANGATLYS